MGANAGRGERLVPTDASAHKTKDLNVLVNGNAIEHDEEKRCTNRVVPRLRLKPTIADDSVWTRDAQTGEIHVQVVKCKKAEPWVGAFEAHCDEATATGVSEEERKRKMQARFHREHPGFDFSDAEFEDGKRIPDASEWNVKYTHNNNNRIYYYSGTTIV